MKPAEATLMAHKALKAHTSPRTIRHKRIHPQTKAMILFELWPNRETSYG
jgi:hypothetical protein